MVLDLLIDAILTALLIGTIAIAIVLNNRITSLRKGQQEMASLVDQLGVASCRAEISIKQLKTTGAAIDAALSEKIVMAQTLTDELGLMNEAGGSLANRLEDKLDDAGEIIRALGKRQPLKKKKFKFTGEHGLLSALKDAR